jgi:hypothetical protein
MWTHRILRLAPTGAQTIYSNEMHALDACKYEPGNGVARIRAERRARQ